MGGCCSTPQPDPANAPSSHHGDSTVVASSDSPPTAPVLQNIPTHYISLVKLVVCCVRDAQASESSRGPQLTATLFNRTKDNEWVQLYCSVLEPQSSGLEAAWHVQFYMLATQDFRILISAAGDLQLQTMTGEAAIRLGELVSQPGASVRKRLPSRLGVRQLVVTAKEDLGPDAIVSFRAQAALPQHKQGPSLHLLREEGPDAWLPLASAEAIQSHQSGASHVWAWPPVATTAVHLCHGSLTQRLRFELRPALPALATTSGTLRRGSLSFGRPSSGSRSSTTDHLVTPRRQEQPQPLGTCVTSLLEMLQSPRHSLPLESPSTTPKSLGDGSDREPWQHQDLHSHALQLELLDVRLDRRPTLLDYLAGGGTIKLLAALDFSRSNPPDAGPGSMHHADPDHPSACEQVVAAFASSLQDYSRARRITLWAFGTSMAGGDLVALNKNPFSPDVQGAAGVSAPYREACSWVHMTNPCRITNIMARMQSMAPPFPPEGTPQQYTVLLVVLAGLPEDVGQLREALAAIAHLPLLVVVAGLGSADFSSLQAITAGHEGASNLRFCSVRLGNPPIRPPLSACNSGGSKDLNPAEPLGPITAADIPSLPHRMLHDLPFRLMRALREAEALPLPPRQMPPQGLSGQSRNSTSPQTSGRFEASQASRA